MTPEARFVTVCSREAVARQPHAVAAAAARVRDWQRVVDLAAEHRVMAYVLRALSESTIEAPAMAASRLAGARLASMMQVMMLGNVLGSLATEMQALQVPVIVLKGPALARTIYPAIQFRPYSDIDLTVQDCDEAAAVAALQRAGYVEVAYAAEDARRAQSSHCDHEGAYHRLFYSQDSEAMVELHLDPLQIGLRPSCEAARWQRAVPVPGYPHVLMLCPEDQIIQLSVHVHKHGFERLIWLKDLDLLLRTYADKIDWDLVLSVARAEGVRPSVWYSLLITAHLLGTPIAPALLRRLRPAAPTRLMYRLVWPIARVADLRGHMRRRAVQFHAAESWRGVLPSLVLMGRRRERLRATFHVLMHR
jgi:hypothetical protein